MEASKGDFAMQNLFSAEGSPLPESLQEDLEELLTWDNNCYLTWVRMGGVPSEESRWFTVKLSSDGRDFGLRLEFWIPAWMTARGVEAVLPASLALSDCVPGERAVVDLGMRKWSEVQASLPKVARTCARLINELWGLTRSEELLLMTVDYQDEQSATPFTALPTYRS
jgi:hypothetical protein